MKSDLKRLCRTALCVGALLLGPTASSQATVLIPGTTVVPDLLAGPAGTLVDTVLTPLTFGGELIANLRAAVVMNAGGTLDFYYQIGNSGMSGTNLATTTDQSFAIPAMTFATDVFYRTDPGGLPVFLPGSAQAVPLSAERSNDGVVVGFNFTAPGTRNSSRINPGEVSRILVIRTNATNYVPGLTTIGNGIITSGQSFAPFAPSVTPEPTSLLLLGSAFAAAGYVARQRIRRKPTAI